MVFIPGPRFARAGRTPALEDGTDRGFRNVGKPQSDAGEIPKRIHTKFSVISRSVLLRMRNISDRICKENQNTLLYSVPIFENRADYEKTLKKKNCTAGQATDDNTAHVHCMLDN